MKKSLVCIVIFFSLNLPLLANRIYPLVMEFQADRAALSRTYANPLSEEFFERMDQLYQHWQARLEALPYNQFTEDEKLDYLLLRNYLEKTRYFHQLEQEEFNEIKVVLDILLTLESFYKGRRRAEFPQPDKLSLAFYQVEQAIAAKINSLENQVPFDSWQQAELAASAVEAFRTRLDEAYSFYADYDPDFTWWMKSPMGSMNKALADYAAFLRDFYENTAVKDDGSGIIGKPMGKEAIEKELRFNYIPYSVEELIRIGEEQYAWCEAEMIQASNELGFGDDWKAALEMVKDTYVPPGKWPEMVVELAEEASRFVEDRDLITVPDLAKETWRTTMMTAEAQRVNPFFLGGESIIISYPTSEMNHEEKMMSMRGNNPHFSRSTVHHELIPGHHLQQFMNQRHFPHRRLFNNPFWVEGWALYWEFNLWDMDFPRNAEDKVGMLFWRMHRAARIVFSLNYHLNQWTPQQCIDFLVDRVGHERKNAEAEVRRSFEGRYGPLYQLAYMIGGLQFYALKEEVTSTGQLTEKAFHDFVMTQNYVPIELLRARMKGDPLPKEFTSQWRFMD
ncbi:X-Pro dipeptidyl-peptidase [Lunatimonas lonarensis]|uniref:X-Pro dipeptidyl-peptidase n=1 Tax=Lunatimonas lonarensis TaxID=1232681 RepID=R7ZTQ4_9BACT|nr:DUF885 family protein [Lunatimonas lonarensis]EON77379.1 X-Pro dipeptidyl-peptidase [Lunatimonas lonarensis]